MTSEGDINRDNRGVRPISQIDWDRLASAIRTGDSTPFDKLYLALFTPLVEFATQLLQDTAVAEDVVQDVFQSLWETRRGRVIHGLRIYMYSAVKKRALNIRRHRGVVRRTNATVVTGHPPALGEPPARPDAAVDRNDLRTTLSEIIRSLPEDRQTIVLLRWRHQLSYPEIAKVLGISLATAQAQVSRVQRAIRPLLAKFMEPGE